MAQGRLLVDAAVGAGAYVIHPSVRGGIGRVGTDIDPADGQQLVGASCGRRRSGRPCWAGDEITRHGQRFEENPDFLDTGTRHAMHPDVAWHRYADWARTTSTGLARRPGSHVDRARTSAGPATPTGLATPTGRATSTNSSSSPAARRSGAPTRGWA